MTTNAQRGRRGNERRRAVVAWVAALGVVSLAACTSTSTSGASPAATGTAVTTASRPATTSVTTTAPTTTAPSTTTTAATTTAPTTTTTTAATTTTTIAEPLDVFDPNCVIRTDRETTFEELALERGLADPVALWFENDTTDIVATGSLVDICPANEVNDIDGQPRPPLDDAAIQGALSSNVVRQQTRLNELFAGSGISDLAVDGISGPRTGQRLCAARLALGLDTTLDDMMPGSNEQAALLAPGALPTPDSTAVESERWVLIDRTCQIMFIGSGTELAFVFPTSTGSAGFETRDQDRAQAFRFNPALDNGGWHDSSEFPVGVDNPLNGNLYKPLYFDLGQAIHGANNVPTTPQSKGCARLRVQDQDTFVSWLGLDTATEETWRKNEMNVTVNVQGNFVPRP